MKPQDESRLTWLSLPGKIESLAQFRDFVLGRAEAADLSETVQTRIDLVLEEILINTFNYAFEDGQAGTVSVGCTQMPDKKSFLLRVTDSGRPFDPLGQTSPDTTRDVGDREVGGLGIHLARQVSSDMVYNHQDGHNVLDIYFRA